MQICWNEAMNEPGLRHGHVTFANPGLSGYRWPLLEVVGQLPGPRLCVMAGVHVNEASSVEAAYQIAAILKAKELRGRVSILPVVNIAGAFEHQAASPVDGKNMHWLYPGNAEGTFSDALAHALVSEWAEGADAVVDMHGGDIGEDLIQYVVYQETRDGGLSSRNEELARCFHPDVMFRIPADWLSRPGRSCTALANRSIPAVVSEAGRFPMLNAEDVAFHVTGVLNIARHLGMIDGAQGVAPSESIVLQDYRFLVAPASGLFYPLVRSGDRVCAGRPLARMKDLFGQDQCDLLAPASGVIMWIGTHLLVKEGEWVAGFGVCA